ncbi:GNAT family N-acetyltransferase [Amycolatopsis sp. NPDC059027]|uniref:GNAT family N-acetyltransferase n=1 Tax=unclassified Amycolatopsis TaxID=2618356 RepID=UPI00367072AD
MRLDELSAVPGADIAPLLPGECPELLVLQRCCWVQEAIANDTLAIPALHETLDDVRDWTRTWSTWRVRQGPRMIAAARARLDGRTWELGRLMVAPDLAGRGLGRWLLSYVENQAPADARRFTLFTGHRSIRNLELYQRAGYRPADMDHPAPGHIAGAVFLTKPRG